jgi:hypothetical protein
MTTAVESVSVGRSQNTSGRHIWNSELMQALQHHLGNWSKSQLPQAQQVQLPDAMLEYRRK